MGGVAQGERTQKKSNAELRSIEQEWCLRQ